ncbi:TetR/AcrR family transcriptional regulator [Dermacoccus sp. Tok2021]|uniref:TetR/AcrR family transcriptional regulator n=1 Tax=Dermacoccus sp. Tok2021 TaxID=2826873 RepID=UPI001CA6AA96|nr:TetR/AcrR family transcriptional regulator [Dermacoccus sp. Tok2021]MBZ4497618.1 TetR/AcrR family transcriptional regulator [Dermacoccus sp. Tok2021]
MPRLDIDTRRTQLIDAAIRIALRDGLDNTTVRRIATEAGVSLGTVHYCFDNKRALLEAVVETLLQREVDVAEFDLPDGATPVDAIKQAFRYYWTLSGAQTERQRLVYELVAYLVRQEAPGPQLAQRIFANKYEVVRGFVELFQKKGEAELGLPADVIARMTVAMTDGVALAWLADGDDEKALEVLDSFAEILARTQT